MVNVNQDYLQLRGSYLFSEIARKVNAYQAANPDKEIIRLGIGDVTLPIAESIITSLHSAVDEMGKKETFKGYAPDLGYEFLRNTIAENDYIKRGCDIKPDEIKDFEIEQNNSKKSFYLMTIEDDKKQRHQIKIYELIIIDQQ